MALLRMSAMIVCFKSGLSCSLLLGSGLVIEYSFPEIHILRA